MRFGAHLPLMDFGGNPYTLDHLLRYTRTARLSGFDLVAANDHLVFTVGWLDGPTALAAVLAESGTMTLATSVALPVVRGPIQLAKALGAIDRLSGGRVVAAVGPGSSARDHEIVGLDFDERWRRLDESIQALRALWSPGSTPYVGSFYSTTDIELLPAPARPGGPPIWVGSWGSDAGLRRTARLADGWLASAYNTTPDEFARAWSRLRELLSERGRDAGSFPNTVGTMWFHLTDDESEAERVFAERIAPTVHRPADVLRQRLPCGPPSMMVDLLGRLQEAGVQRVIVWPVTDEVEQLERFAATVMPAFAHDAG